MTRTRTTHPSRALTLIALTMLALSTLPILPAAAHGKVDQRHTGDPACDEKTYEGFAVTGETLRQQFVPTTGNLGAIDLCLKILAPITSANPVEVRILKQSGSSIKGDHGDAIQTAFIKNEPVGTIPVHVELPAAITGGITPGDTYIIEIPPTQATFQWLAACGTNVLPCSKEPKPDPYPRGGTNYDGIVDFWFRTLPANLPDLVGTLTAPSVVCPGQAFGDTLSASISNVTQIESGAGSAGIYLSSDPVITSSDVKVGSTTFGNLKGGQRAALTFTDLRMPATLPDSLAPDRRAHIGLIVDDGDQIPEATESNNVAIEELTITTCDHAAVSAPTISINRDESTPGAFRVPIADVDPSNLSIVAEESATVGTFDIDSTPIRPIDLTSLFEGAPSHALDQILLSSIPYPHWRKILDAPGSQYVGMPLHAVSLRDVLTLNPDVTLQETPLGKSGLKGMTAAAILSAGTPLNDLGTPGQPWCDLLASSDHDCGRLSIDPTRDTLLHLNLLGFRAVPWKQMPSVTEMDLAENAPLRTTHLAGSTATDHYQILQTPFRTVPVSALSDFDAIVECSAVPGGCDDATLASVENAGAFKSNATVGDLLDRMPSGSKITLGEAALGIFARDDLAWELMDHDRFRPQAVKPFGDPLTYTVRFTNIGSVSLVDPKVSVALPHNFVAVDEPATIVSPADAEASAPAVTGDTVSFAVRSLVAPDEEVVLRFKAFPWTRLGRFDASASVSWLDAGAATPDHAHKLSGDPGASVRIIDIETAIPNDSPVATGEAAAPLLEADTLLYTTVGVDDEDFFRLPDLPAGSTVRVSMTSTAPAHVNNDFDLAVYRLGGEGLDSLPIRPIDLTALPASEDGWEINSTETRISPEMLDDLPIRPIDLTSLSVNRQTSDEAVTVPVSSGDGPLLIQVFGYNGSFSADPLMLRVKVTAPASLGECTTPDPVFEGQRATDLIWQPTGMLNSDVNTLFVFDQERTGDLYGPTDAAALRARLREVAARADLGVKGAVVSIDADLRVPIPSDPGSTVPTARAAVDSDPCDVQASNTLVRATTSLLAQVRTSYPGVENVVVVGNNAVIPPYFSRDHTWKSNEIDNVRDMLDATGNTVMTTAMATRHFPTDALYGSRDAVAYLNERIFPPEYALGRLAGESADAVVDILDRFELSGGKISPAKATVASIDILSDGADTMADSLAARLGVEVSRLDDEPADPNDGWNAGDLRAATTEADPSPGIISVGAHATHRDTLASRGGVFSAADIAASSLDGGVVAMSNGCHFGLNLPNSAVADAGKTLDWTEAYLDKGAAVVIGSAGFAYANRSGVAYSEELMERFTSWIGTGTLGDAWKNAITDYISGLLAIDAFDHKTLGEFVFNGMPHYRIAGVSAEPPTVPNVVGNVAPDDTGLNAGPISLSFGANDPKSQRVQTPDGTYYTWDGDFEAKSGYPIVGRFIGEVKKQGLNPQDVLVTGLETVQEDNDPVFAGAVVSSKESGESQSLSAVSPSLPVRVTTEGRAVFRLGHFRAMERNDGSVTGVLSRVTGFTGKIYYGDGGKRPIYERTDAEIGVDGGANVVRFSVRMAATTPPLKVVGLFRDASGWHTVHFTKSALDPQVWTAQAPLSGTVLLDTFVQALGNTGRVGVTVIKGAVETLRSPLIVKGPRGANGWFKGPVTIELDETGGVQYTYELNGVQRDYTGPFEVGDEGINELYVLGSDHGSASATIPIDTTAPSLSVDLTDGATFTFGEAASLSFDCADQTSGITSCSATLDGQPISNGSSLTRTAGSHSLVVTAVDAAGLSTTVTRTFHVIGFTLIGFESPVEKKPPLLNDRKAGDTIPLKWKVFLPNGIEKTELSVLKGVFEGRIDCAAPTDSSRWGKAAAATSNPSLRYAGHFKFNATTDSSLQGKCSRYIAEHIDGSQLMVFVRHT